MDFSTSKYNLRAIPTDKVFDEYPDLFTLYSEVSTILNVPRADITPPSSDDGAHPGLSPSQAVSLVVYSYHHQSPLVRQYAGMHQRRTEALKLLAFTIEKAEDIQNNKQLWQYIIGSNYFINNLAVHFCKFEPNSSKWLELCRKQDMIDRVFLNLAMEAEGTTKLSPTELLTKQLVLDKEAEGLQRRINQLSTEIFAGDLKLMDISEAHRILETRKPLITPERVVARKREVEATKN